MIMNILQIRSIKRLHLQITLLALLGLTLATFVMNIAAYASEPRSKESS